MSGLLPSLLLIHAAATLYLVGLIWTIQLVHYPLLAKIGREGFVEYAADHRRRMVLALAPAWPVEGITAAWLLFAAPDVPAALAWIGAALVGVIIGSTALVQVPLHGRLDEGYDAEVIRRLVTTNWLRTVAWTARGAVAVALLAIAA